MMKDLFWIMLSAAIVNNFTLTMFLGLCSFFGVTRKAPTALRLGIANTMVMVLTSVVAWALNATVLRAAPYLRIVSFIVVIASLVQIVEMIVRKYAPVLFRELGIYLPLITTNCAVLGFAIFQTNRGYNLLQGLAFAFGAGVGLIVALSLMASLRERIELSTLPSMARGMGVVFIIAGGLALAFMGFAGLFSAQ